MHCHYIIRRYNSRQLIPLMALVARSRSLFMIGEADAGAQDAAAYITRGPYVQPTGSYIVVSATSQFRTQLVNNELYALCRTGEIALQRTSPE